MTLLVNNLSSLLLSNPLFPDLTLTGATTDSAGNTFTIQACDDASTWGAPIPIDVAVQRWMTDGAVASTQGNENRELAFKIIVSGATSVALAAAEAALALRADQISLLTWVPPEGTAAGAPSTVFEVWTWHLEHDFDSINERHLERMYTVTMTAKPWVRSVNRTTAAANPTGGSPTITQIDACTSTTGWTGSPAAVSVFGGTAIREAQTVTITGGPKPATRTLTRTGSVTGMGATPYLALDVRPANAYLTSLTVTVNGQACTKVGSVGSVSYWQVPAGVTTFTTLVMTAVFNVTATASVVLDCYDVTKTDAVGVVGSHKMLARHLDVGGSVKTSGSIQIASPSATVLGNCLIYTCPDNGSGYNPNTIQYRSGGNVPAVDATCVSGFHTQLAGGSSTGEIRFTAPAGVYRPGTYAVVARLQWATGTFPTAPVAVKFATTADSGGSNILDSFTTTVPGAAAAGFVWFIFGTITLPGSARPPESALSVFYKITSLNFTNGGALNVDELFLLDVTHGAYSLVTSVTGGTFTRLWIDAPDADPLNNLPQIYTGAQADRSDAGRVGYSQIMAPGDHDLDPSGAMVFTVTDGVDDAAVTASFYQRWHTHAAA